MILPAQDFLNNSTMKMLSPPCWCLTALILDFYPFLVSIHCMRVGLWAETGSCDLQINDNILLTVSAAKRFRRLQKPK